MRIKFKKGKQREFLKLVLSKINCPSLRELRNRGFDIPYSTLRNYFNEDRCLPENLFSDLCYLSKINKDNFEIKYLSENWGQIRGGKNKK